MSWSMRSSDRTFGGLLFLGSLLHAGGSLSHYAAGTPELVWALSGSLAGGLTAAINLIRCERPQDFTLAWVALTASLAWFAVATGFGASIGNLFDPRVLWHAICALALVGFSLRTGLGLTRSEFTPRGVA
jgi:hypothetical protein